jgi:PH-interacting protein
MPLSFSSKEREIAQLAESETSRRRVKDVDVDLSEVYFLIMHFLSAGPCQRTYVQFWNELLEHQLLPRRYHAWYSRSGAHSGDENDNGLSFPLSYNSLEEQYAMCSLSLSLSLSLTYSLTRVATHNYTQRCFCGANCMCLHKWLS